MADTTPEAAGSRERAPLLAEAPGRVNLIGEHTDYNAGLVLPVALPLATRVALLPRDDGLVRVRSRELGSAEYRLGAERRGRGWLDHVQALTVVLAADGFACEGFEASIASDVPIGSGLASSAALAVALLRAIRAAFALRFDDVRLALLAQRAENEFVGARVGVMDQLAASLGRPGVALFIDTRSLDVTLVPLPDGIELGVVDSGVRHEHAAGGYNERRAECERAASLLGVRALGELGSGDLERLGALPPPLDRRARHVVTEDARVREMVAALRAGDLGLVGALLTASHRSLRDDFAVSVPEVDRIVALAAAHPAVVGARLTGGGFGGAVLFVAERGTSREVASRVAAAARAEGIAARAVLPVDPPPAS